MYTVTRNEASVTLDVISCIVSSCGTPIFVLIDSGLTYSYINTKFSLNIHKKIEPLSHDLSVDIGT